MLKEFLSFWSDEEDLLDKAVDEFNGMLQSLTEMFDWAMNFTWNWDGQSDMKDLYKSDIRINKAERHIRKQIIEHLTFQPGKGANQSLILMSVVKDAERIGDYCKNLAEVAIKHGSALPPGHYADEIQRLQANIATMFETTYKCFHESDKTLAEQVHESETVLSKSCEDYVLKLMRSDDLSVADAISYTLVVRFFKRIIGHLGNITSSVSMPIHKLDFYDETLAPGTEDSYKQDS